MDPQGGNSNSNQPPTAPTAGSDVGASNPLGGSGNPVADAANQAADAAQTAPTPAQTPAENDFAKQFGGEVPPVVEPISATPPPAEPNVADPMGQALAGLETPSVTAVPESKPEDQSSAPVAASSDAGASSQVPDLMSTLEALNSVPPATQEAAETPAPAVPVESKPE